MNTIKTLVESNIGIRQETKIKIIQIQVMCIGAKRKLKVLA